MYRGKELTIPSHTVIPEHPGGLESVQDGVRISRVKEQDWERTKEFMARTFYATANVPRVLNMAESYKKHPIVEQEIGND